MPTNIRRMLSVVVALMTIAVFFFEQQSGQNFLRWYALVLGVVLVAAVWLFPEAKKRSE